MVRQRDRPDKGSNGPDNGKNGPLETVARLSSHFRLTVKLRKCKGRTAVVKKVNTRDNTKGERLFLSCRRETETASEIRRSSTYAGLDE